MQSNSHLEPIETLDHRRSSYEPDISAVLLIEGDIRYRAALNGNFLRHGWQVTTVTCVHEALRVIDQQIVDLVICDLQMSDGDVHQVMLALDAGTPIIVIASNASTADVVRAMRNGAFDFLAKDVSFDVLQVIARTAVNDSARTNPMIPTELKKIIPPATADPLSRAVMTLSDLNRTHLEAALALAKGNRTNTAKLLGISVRTVRNKIRQYGLPPRSYA